MSALPEHKPRFKLPPKLRLFAWVSVCYVVASLWGLFWHGVYETQRFQSNSADWQALEQLKARYAGPVAINCGTYSWSVVTEWNSGNKTWVDSCSQASMILGLPFKTTESVGVIDSGPVTIMVGDSAGRLTKIYVPDYGAPGATSLNAVVQSKPELSRNYWFARFLLIFLLCHGYVKLAEYPAKRKVRGVGTQSSVNFDA